MELESLRSRPAREDYLPSLNEIMWLAIERLQSGFLSAEQIAASHAVMGLDNQLVADRTYYVVEIDGKLAGCGGWSRRSTLYGGDVNLALRDARLLDPNTEAARVRAMYTHSDFVKQDSNLLRAIMPALAEGGHQFASGSPCSAPLHQLFRTSRKGIDRCFVEL